MVPARHTDRTDQGSLQTLEVVIVASLMTSAVVFVATFESEPQGSAPVRGLLQQQADDTLDILYDTQLAGGRGDLLSAYILDCMQDSCDALTRKLDKLLPDGADYALYISNGGSLYPVYAPREPPGEAVTARHLIEPAWSHTFVSTGAAQVNPNEDALVTYALPVHKSMPLAEGGSPLLVRVHGTRVSDGADYVLTGAFSTEAFDASDASRAAAVSLYFADAAGNPLGVTDATSKTLYSGIPSLANVTFRVRVEETAGVAVPANTTLTVRLPNGWYGWAPQNVNNGTWLVLQNATDYNASYEGSAIQARLLQGFSSGARDLVFNATYRGDVVDYYPFHASLSRGASSSATLLVRADTHGTQPALEVPSLHLSAPKPMGATATTKWTLAAYVPDEGGTFGSQAVDVTRIEILEGEGATIFGAATGLSGGGDWSVNGSRLVWTGSHRIEHAAPLNLTFALTASGTDGSHDTRTGFVAPATFDGWTGRIVPQVAPGLFRGTFLPDSGEAKGYNGETGLALTAEHTVRSDGVYRTTPLPGSATYDAGYYAGLRDSLHGAYIGIDDRTAPLGGALNLTVDVQSMLYTVAALGYNPDVTLRVYPPWASSTSGAIVERELLDASVVVGLGSLLDLLDLDGDGVADPTAHGRFNESIPIPETWLFGTYVVEVELDWTEEVNAVVAGTPLSGTFDRTARLYDYFLVTPHDGLLSASPVYDVHLVTWFDDWR